MKNLRRLFDKYAVARTEHDALFKSPTKIFLNFVAFSENPNFNWIAWDDLKDKILEYEENWQKKHYILSYLYDYLF